MGKRRSSGPAGIGFELGGAVAGGTLLGVWIDRHYDTWPWGVVTCFTLALIGGLYNLLRAVHRASSPDRDTASTPDHDDDR